MHCQQTVISINIREAKIFSSETGCWSLNKDYMNQKTNEKSHILSYKRLILVLVKLIKG